MTEFQKGEEGLAAKGNGEAGGSPQRKMMKENGKRLKERSMKRLKSLKRVVAPSG